MTVPVVSCKVGGRIRVVVGHYLPGLAVLAFLLRKLAYRRRLRRNALDAAPVEVAEHVTALHRDGIVVIPDFLDATTVEAMRHAIPDEAVFEQSPEGDPVLFHSDAHRIDALTPFFDHPIITTVARAYISVSAIPLRRTVELKVVHGDVRCFELFWHMDTWKKRLKAILYLVRLRLGPPSLWARQMVPAAF